MNSSWQASKLPKFFPNRVVVSPALDFANVLQPTVNFFLNVLLVVVVVGQCSVDLRQG